MKRKLAQPASAYSPLATIVPAIVHRQAKPKLIDSDPQGIVRFAVSLKELGIEQLQEDEIVALATRWTVDLIGELLLRCNIETVESVIAETECYKELVAVSEHRHFGLDFTKHDAGGRLVFTCHVALFSKIMGEALEVMAHEGCLSSNRFRRDAGR